MIADTGEVYAGDGAWFACLWALTDHRSTAERLARPHLLPSPGRRWPPPRRSGSGSATRGPSRPTNRRDTVTR
ncbi:hypothetical protein NKG94_26730 [Micromonospora sp. M12]